MKQRRIRFTRTAQAQVERERAWWFANRDHVEIFAEDFEPALRVLGFLPGAGTPYTLAGIPSLRRIYLGKIGYHIYYTFDESEVIVRAFWGAHAVAARSADSSSCASARAGLYFRVVDRRLSPSPEVWGTVGIRLWSQPRCSERGKPPRALRNGAQTAAVRAFSAYG